MSFLGGPPWLRFNMLIGFPTRGPLGFRVPGFEQRRAAGHRGRGGGPAHAHRAHAALSPRPQSHSRALGLKWRVAGATKRLGENLGENGTQRG